MLYFKIVSNFTGLMARQITYNNFEISLVVFMPNITTNHAITYTNLLAKLQLLVYKSTLDKKLNMALLKAGGITSSRCFVIRFSRSSLHRRNRLKLSDHICNIPIFFSSGRLKKSCWSLVEFHKPWRLLLERKLQDIFN